MAIAISRSAPDRADRGFTLLEVLIAVAILAIALVALLSLHGRNIRVVAYDRQLSRATLLAQGVMTRTLVADPFPDPTQDRGEFADDPGFRWQVEVLHGPTRDLEDVVREVRVRVFWDANDLDAVRLVTLVRKPTP